jgi:hypothetical protein
MTISRRRFAQTAGIAVAAISLSGSAPEIFSQTTRSNGLYPLSAAAYGEHLLSLNCSAFQGLIGTIFRSEMGNREILSLRLMEVKISPPVNKVIGNGEEFSLLFRSIGRKRIPEGLHTFDHPTLGNFSLFVAPVERARMNLEAVINHTIVQ